MKRLLWALLVSLAACGGEADEGSAGAEIAEDYNRALDEAAAVEDKLEERKADLDAAVGDGRNRDDD